MAPNRSRSVVVARRIVAGLCLTTAVTAMAAPAAAIPRVFPTVEASRAVYDQSVRPFLAAHNLKDLDQTGPLAELLA